MSTNNLNELKTKVKKSLTEHLESVNWKLGDDQKVFDELPNMWRKLETDGLMSEIKALGMTFEHFALSAQNKYKEIKIREQVEADLAAFSEMFKRGRR